LKNNKPIILFLARFFVSYFLFLGIYSFYLKNNQINKVDFFSCAPITKSVANQASKMMNFFGYHTKIEQHPTELSIKVLVSNNYVARVIEGCNSVSVIILFLAFIIAFKGNLIQTILFGIFGSILIYVVNLVRIGILSIGLHKYPGQEKLLHDLIFPAIVYGMVLLLWIVWVNKFSNFNKN
jgi:exosortase family protein XrtF